MFNSNGKTKSKNKKTQQSDKDIARGIAFSQFIAKVGSEEKTKENKIGKFIPFCGFLI